MRKLILALIPGVAVAGLPPQKCTGLNYIQCLPGEKINASSIALGSQVSGTLPVANGGSGVTALSNVLGTTNQVTVSGGTARVIGGDVTLSLPQNIHTAATPTFGGMTLTGFSGVCKASAGVLSASTIVDADVSASAAIADTKLATISTSGKVSNSATTATNLNTASAIVARDGSGNFSAGTITAALSGNASTASALAADPTDCGAGTKAIAIGANGNLTCTAVSLTADVSGVMPLANGGTNKNMTAVNGGVVWTDADSQEVTAAGTSGQFLKSNGAAAPSWQSTRTFWRVNANIATTNTSEVSLGTGSQSTYATIENANLQLTNNSVNSDPAMLTAQITCAGTTAPSGATCTAVNEVIGVAFTIPSGGEGSARACFAFSQRFAGGTAMDSSVAFAIYETGTANQTAGQGGYRKLSSRSTVDNDTVTGQFVVCDDFYFSTSGQKAIRLFYEQASSNSNGSFIYADAEPTVGQRDINVQIYPVGVGF